MGKQYKANVDEIAIVDGKLVNCSVTDNFSSQNDTTKESRALECVTFTLDGLDVATLVDFLWGQAKVKAQARTFKNLTDEQFLAMDGGTHSILDYIPKSGRVGNKTAIVNKVLLEQQKKFMDKALTKAVEALGADVEPADHIAWATKYYDEEYADLIAAPE